MLLCLVCWLNASVKCPSSSIRGPESALFQENAKLSSFLSVEFVFLRRDQLTSVLGPSQWKQAKSNQSFLGSFFKLLKHVLWAHARNIAKVCLSVLLFFANVLIREGRVLNTCPLSFKPNFSALRYKKCCGLLVRVAGSGREGSRFDSRWRPYFFCSYFFSQGLP